MENSHATERLLWKPKWSYVVDSFCGKPTTEGVPLSSPIALPIIQPRAFFTDPHWLLTKLRLPECRYSSYVSRSYQDTHATRTHISQEAQQEPQGLGRLT